MTQVTQHRTGETGHYPFRSERLYFSGDAWYFLIRGGSSKGPFSTAQVAKDALNSYVETLKQLHEVFHKPTDDDHHHYT